MQRRHHGRYRIWFPVRLEAEAVDGMAVNHNISAGGMLVALSTKLSEGERVRVHFRMPPDSQARHAVEGKVVRIEGNPEDPDGMWPYRIAVAFDDVDPELVPFLEAAAQHLAEME
ncbi:MAG: PilZ domain-containing protein [Myxococcales bacterium]